MGKKRKKRRKSWRWAVGSILVLAFLVVCFSSELLTLGVRVALSLTFPDASFREAYIEECSLILTHLKIRKMQIPKLQVHVDLSFNPLRLQPTVILHKPTITIKGAVPLLPDVSKHMEASLVVKNGTLLCRGERYGLSFASKQGREGEMSLSAGYGLPALFCEWKGKHFSLRMQRAPLKPIVALIPACKGWEVEGGEVEFEGEGVWSEIVSLKGKGALQNVAIVGEEGDRLFAQEVVFSIDLPHKLLEGEVKEGKAVLGEWEISRINGTFAKREELPFEVMGDGVFSGMELKGNVQGEGVLSWDGEVAFEEEGALFHVSRRDQALTVSFDNFDAYLFNLGQEALFANVSEVMEWEVTEGRMSGEFVKEVNHLSLRKFSGTELKVQHLPKKWFASVGKIEGKGEFRLTDLFVESVQTTFVGVDADLLDEKGEIWNLSSLGGTFSMQDGSVTYSWVNGSFLGLEGQLTFQGPTFWSDTQFELSGCVDQVAALISYDLAQIYHESDEIPMRIKGRMRKNRFVADLFFGEKERHPLHLEADLPPLEEVTFSAERLSPQIYAPLMVSLFPSLDVGGEMRVGGDYVHGDLHCQARMFHSHFKLAEHLIVFDCEAKLEISKERDNAWRCSAHVAKGKASFSEKVQLKDVSFETVFDEKEQKMRLSKVQAQEQGGLTFSSDALYVDPNGEKWTWGKIIAKKGEQTVFTGKIEALVHERNPHAFLLLFQKEDKNPQIFQGRRYGKMWKIEPLENH